MSRQNEELLKAVQSGDFAACKRAIDAGASINRFSGAWGALHEACDSGNAEICRFLIDAGADVTMFGNHRTPLMLASRRGRVEICRMLIGAGADPCQRGANDDNALYEACFQGHVDVVTLLIQAGAPVGEKLMGHDISVLMTAAGRGHGSLCSLLINAGADVEAKSDSGQTALARAIREKKLAAFKALVSAGADIGALIQLANTPPLTSFQMAIQAEATEIVEYMLDELGEDPAQRTVSGKTMVQLAGKNKEIKQLINSAKTASRVIGAVGVDQDTVAPAATLPSRVKPASVAL